MDLVKFHHWLTHVISHVIMLCHLGDFSNMGNFLQFKNHAGHFFIETPVCLDLMCWLKKLKRYFSRIILFVQDGEGFETAVRPSFWGIEFIDEI